MKGQRTSTTEPVSEGLAELLGRMIKDAAKKYQGGNTKADLAKGHPDFAERTYDLWDILAAEQALRLPIIERPAWKIVKLGIHKNADEYRTAIKSAGGRISNWADDILSKPAFTVSDQPTDIDLVLVTVAELGYEKGATRAEIYKRAAEFGLEPCPAEVGPALREQYMDQSKGEWIIVGMEPIVGSYGDPFIFDVEHDANALWLDDNYGGPDDVWDADIRWVFVRK